MTTRELREKEPFQGVGLHGMALAEKRRRDLLDKLP